MINLSRRNEIEGNLATVRQRIGEACRHADRDPADVTLVAITKTFPVSDVEHLAALGVGDVGENRAQELAAKHADYQGPRLRWHFVGQLQLNKAGVVANHADVVHSVDRRGLVDRLERVAGQRRLEPLMLLVQVSLDAEPGRGGAPPEDVPELADAVAHAAGLRLGGVMAVAPLGGDPAAAFARLRDVAGRIQEQHPAARIISAGMSGDFEVAIRYGATHVRIGTALLGHRPPPVG